MGDDVFSVYNGKPGVKRLYSSEPIVNGIKVITKEDAEATGLKRFFTGLPCAAHGHICERDTKYARCVECAKLKRAITSKKECVKAAEDVVIRKNKLMSDPIPPRDSFDNNKWPQYILAEIKRRAKEQGVLEYVGNICSKHPDLDGLRTIWNGTCVECARISAARRARERHAKNPEKVRCYQKKHRQENLEACRERENIYYWNNRQKELDKHKRWRSKPDVAQRLRANANQFSKDNPEYCRAAAMMRKAVQIRATLSTVEFSDFIGVYMEAQRLIDETGNMHHVDHIVPLRGKFVCGLHVPWNLRALPASDNLSKSNKHESDSWWDDATYDDYVFAGLVDKRRRAA